MFKVQFDLNGKNLYTVAFTMVSTIYHDLLFQMKM